MGNEAVLLDARFSPKLRIYLILGTALPLLISFIGIPLLIIWLLVGPWWARRHFESLACILTERSLIVRKGTVFKRETTIPLDKIQDISLREGPLLRWLGLLSLRIETAGQNTSASGFPEASLTGLVDARQVRDQILAQRDRISHGELAPGRTGPLPVELLAEIRDSLLRIESALNDRR